MPREPAELGDPLELHRRLTPEELVELNATPPERTRDMRGVALPEGSRLTVRAWAGSYRSGEARWLCRCKCGAWAYVCGASLRSGKVRSCGCLRTEVTCRLGLRHTAMRERARVELGRRVGEILARRPAR